MENEESCSWALMDDNNYTGMLARADLQQRERADYQGQIEPPEKVVLELEVPKLADLKDQGLTSACVLIGDLTWQLKLCKQNANDNQQTEQPQQEQYLIYANCNENGKEHFWFCSAKFAFYSKQEEGEEQMAMISSTGPMNAYYGNSQLLIGSINPSKTHPILLIVEVQIVQVQPKMFALDTNMEVRMTNGITTSVAVNKQGLAVISNYFHNLFFAQQWEEFVIREEDNPAFDIDTFRLMIYGALSLSWMVPELLELFKEGSRMLDILKLAHKYDIRPLIKHCENQLILDPKTYPPNSEMLQLSEHMTLITNHCLAKMNAVESMENSAAAAGCSGEDNNSSADPEKSAMKKLDSVLQEHREKLKQNQKNCSQPLLLNNPYSNSNMAASQLLPHQSWPNQNDASISSNSNGHLGTIETTDTIGNTAAAAIAAAGGTPFPLPLAHIELPQSQRLTAMTHWRQSSPPRLPPPPPLHPQLTRTTSDEMANELKSKSKARMHLRLNSEQIRILEEEFGKCNYPTKWQRLDLSCKLGLSEMRVQQWFYYRRRKKKQSQKDEIIFLGHKISQEPSSSAYRNAAVGPLLAEEGMPCLQNENYPSGLRAQPPMRNEAATINIFNLQCPPVFMPLCPPPPRLPPSLPPPPYFTPQFLPDSLAIMGQHQHHQQQQLYHHHQHNRPHIHQHKQQQLLQQQQQMTQYQQQQQIAQHQQHQQQQQQQMAQQQPQLTLEQQLALQQQLQKQLLQDRLLQKMQQQQQQLKQQQQMAQQQQQQQQQQMAQQQQFIAQQQQLQQQHQQMKQQQMTQHQQHQQMTQQQQLIAQQQQLQLTLQQQQPQQQQHQQLQHQQQQLQLTLQQQQQQPIAQQLQQQQQIAQQQQGQQCLEKLFECKLCGKSTRQRNNLKMHILRHHQKEQRGNIGIDKYIIIKSGRGRKFNVEQERKQPIPQQKQEEGMPLGHQLGQSSSTNGIAAAGDLAEEGSKLGQYHCPLMELIAPQPTKEEDARMNIAGEHLPNSSANADAASEQNLAVNIVPADDGEDYRLKWEPISPASTQNETAPTEAADAVGTVNLEENDNNNNNNKDDYDRAGGSSVFSSSSPIPGPSSSSCPPPPPPPDDQHPSAVKLTQEFRRIFARFVESINSREYTMDVTIGVILRLPDCKKELDILNPSGQDMEEIKQSLRQIGTEMLERAKKGRK